MRGKKYHDNDKRHIMDAKIAHDVPRAYFTKMNLSVSFENFLYIKRIVLFGKEGFDIYYYLYLLLFIIRVKKLQESHTRKLWRQGDG